MDGNQYRNGRQLGDLPAAIIPSTLTRDVRPRHMGETPPLSNIKQRTLMFLSWMATIFRREVRVTFDQESNGLSIFCCHEPGYLAVYKALAPMLLQSCLNSTSLVNSWGSLQELVIPEIRCN